jgi:hypothetical protein
MDEVDAMDIDEVVHLGEVGDRHDSESIAAIVDLRLVPKTKQVYASKMNVFTAYLRERHPTLVDEDGNILLELLPIKYFEAFLVKKQAQDHLGFSALSVHIVSTLLLALILVLVLVPIPDSPIRH